MLKKVDFYYFSPTGGTKRAGEALACALAEEVNYIDLGQAGPGPEGECEVAVFAAPVFVGRIPEFFAEKVKKLNGSGKKAVTAAVYGVRAYEDALLELNDVAAEAGFEVVGSVAAVSQHSVVTIVGTDRPDGQDEAELRDFAAKVLEKLQNYEPAAVTVPGNRPYREGGNFTLTPVCLPSCGGCGACIKACPTEAMKLEEGQVKTEVEKCILCIACTKACPSDARVVPAPFVEMMHGKLGHLRDLRRENEFYI